jgi:hypothetical protein
MSDYPDVPGAVAGCDTSEAAGASLVGIAGQVRQIIYAHLQASLRGRTCEEIEQALNLRHQTTSARLRELVLLGLVEDTGRRRLTSSGRSARVYAVREMSGQRP